MRLRTAHAAILVFAFTLVAAAGTQASDWPQWRGPTGMGQSPERNLPLTWGGPSDENVRWRAALPECSESPSSPIVSRGRVVVTTARAEPLEQRVSCYRASDGTPMWSAVVPPGPWKLGDMRAGYCCATPATDGRLIVVVFGSATIAALNYQGEIVWQKDMAPHGYDVGIGSSPVFYKDTVISYCDQRKGASYITAYDARTGATKWTVARHGMTSSYSTPLLVDVKGTSQLVVSAPSALQGLDPEDGKVIWTCAPYKGYVTSPAYSDGFAYCDDGTFGGANGICVDVTGTGDVSATHLAWKARRGIACMSSPLIVAGRVYKFARKLHCWDLRTGAVVYGERLERKLNSSPVATADGRIYYGGAGTSWVIQAGATFELLGKSDLGEPSSASPAVADGCLFLKGTRTLFCVGTR